jgi:hypothetical protein
MIKLLEEVIIQRQAKNDNNTVIQLSSVFMKKAIDSFNKEMDIGQKPLLFNSKMNELSFNYHGRIYIIINRAYQDDSNDPDVEEIIINVLNLK